MANIDLKHRQKSNELVFAQFNLKFERGINQYCDLCRASYSVFNRQHVCKRCYRSICADCSPFKVKTYLSSRNIRLHRNCTVCNAQSVKIQQYIEQNKLRFRQDSDLLFIWSKTLADRRGVKVSRSKSSLKSYVKLQNLWGSFNFSFRQFIGRLVQTSNIGDADLINIINNGLEEIQRINKDRVSEGLYIYLFFLCHADVQISVNLTLFILQLLEKSSITKGSLKKLMQNVGFSEIQMYKLQEFILDNESLLKDSASVNVLPVTASFQIINSAIFNKNISFMWKGIFLYIFQRKQIVFKNLNRISAIIVDLLRNHNIVNLKTQLKEKSELLDKDLEAKYGKLMNQYITVAARNKELQQASNRSRSNKILTDSLIGEEFTTHSNNFKSEEFYQILQNKNEEIIRLKMKNQELQTNCKVKTLQVDNYSIQNLKMKNQLIQKDQKLSKLQLQKNILKNINTLLLQKMKDLSKMLMDQQQRQILKNDAVIQQIAKQLGQQKKEECTIY